MVEKTLSHYSVIEKIGEGGMGEVYRAHDTKLGRDVALKILPESFALDDDRLSRFEREAKLLATLNHANIASIYGIEQSQSQRFLVLELVEGLDLAERLREGPVAEDDVLQVCLKIAEALEAAHEQGVVHRDLKPANVKVSPDGTVKVLDFGLAKALDIDEASGDLSKSPTLLASSPTMQGVILGTAAYMSPEQARGKLVDRRADIWGFGCVLFELLTGKQAFSGETVSDTLASVLKMQPDWDALPSGTPLSVQKLLSRCLDKDPRQRLRDIGEARIVIDKILRGDIEEEAGETIVASRPSMLRRIAWPAGAVVGVVLAGILAWMFKPGSIDVPLRKFSLAVESEAGHSPGRPVISPDGSKVVYILAGGLWIQEFGELEPRQLPTETGASTPFWSPDGSLVGYVADNQMYKVPVSGGASVKICDPQPSFTGGRGASWGEDDRIVFSFGSTGLFQVSAQGGDPTSFLDLNPETDGDFHEPELLPGGRGVLFVTHRKNGTADTIELSAGGERKVLVQIDGQRLWHPVYAASGHVIYRRAGANGGIWAVPFSLSKLETTGDPFLLTAEGASPSVSVDGTLVYLRGGSDNTYQMAWVEREGILGELIGVPTPGMASPAISPDGTQLALVEFDNDNVDVWTHNLARGTRTRFTFDDGTDLGPEWSPDGQQIYYWRGATDTIYVRRADGTGTPRAVVRGRTPSISPDGQLVAYHIQGHETQEDIWYASVDGSVEPTTIRATAARELNAAISPDGRHLAYVSLESGTAEVYLTRFPSGEGKWQVSTGGGRYPAWSRSGQRLYYRTNRCDIMELSVSTDPTVTLGNPVKLIDCASLELEGSDFMNYAVFGEGERFIMRTSLGAERGKIDVGITVVQNWTAEFNEHGNK
jgi:serine/threonine-protein kinase